MKTIVWDVDDVLNDLMREWLTFWKKSHGKCRLMYDGLTENPPHALLGITKEQYLRSLDIFRNSAKGVGLKPNPTILRWFRASGHLARHIALTSRPLHTVPNLSAWVFRWFGKWIRTFAYVPTRSDKSFPTYSVNKAEYLKWIKTGEMFVDDTQYNIESVKRLGVKSFLYPRPWNNSQASVAQLLSELTKCIQGKNK